MNMTAFVIVTEPPVCYKFPQTHDDYNFFFKSRVSIGVILNLLYLNPTWIERIENVEHNKVFE